MSTYPTLYTAIHDLTGALVLDLSPGTGYRRVALTGNAGSTFSENLTSSAYVEGATEVTPGVRIALKRAERIKVKGAPGLTGEAYWQSVEDRIIALEQAVAQRFLWVVNLGGYVWTYRSAGKGSVDATDLSRDHLAGGYRMVALTFTAQPNPTKAVAP